MVGQETLEVENPAEALRNQDGTFKVVSPYGHIFQVTCRRGSNMRIRQIGDKSEAQLLSDSRSWRIEKIGGSPAERQKPADNRADESPALSMSVPPNGPRG